MEIFLVLVLQKQKCVLASRTSPPPRLPVKISDVLATTWQRGKQPEAVVQGGLGTLQKFLQESGGAAAPDVVNPERQPVC
jgi:hypothetical protein